MKLFLASSADKTLSFLPTLAPTLGKNVLFVANAADPYPGEKFWVTNDREAFKQLGYQIHEVDLREISPEQLQQLLHENDILHICGGSVYYLVALLRERRLESVIIDAVQKDVVVYTSTSAGSIVVSKNLKPFSYDEEEAEQIKKVPDHTGLGLVDFGIVPHCNNPLFSSEHKKMVEKMSEDVEPLFFLQDSDAIWVEDGKMQFLRV